LQNYVAANAASQIIYGGFFGGQKNSMVNSPSTVGKV